MMTQDECGKKQWKSLSYRGYYELHILAKQNKEAAQEFWRRLAPLSPCKGIASGSGKPAEIKQMLQYLLEKTAAVTQVPAK